MALKRVAPGIFLYTTTGRYRVKLRMAGRRQFCRSVNTLAEAEALRDRMLATRAEDKAAESRPGRPWTGREERELIRLGSGRHTIEEVCDRLDRTFLSLVKKVERLRAQGRVVTFKDRPRVPSRANLYPAQRDPANYMDWFDDNAPKWCAWHLRDLETHFPGQSYRDAPSIAAARVLSRVSLPEAAA